MSLFAATNLFSGSAQADETCSRNVSVWSAVPWCALWKLVLTLALLALAWIAAPALPGRPMELDPLLALAGHLDEDNKAACSEFVQVVGVFMLAGLAGSIGGLMRVIAFF